MLSSVESFCYAALLKNPKTLAAQLALLTDERRSKIGALINELRVLPEADRRRRWQGLRRAEAEAKTRDCLEQYGAGFRTFSPRLKIWLCQAF